MSSEDGGLVPIAKEVGSLANYINIEEPQRENKRFEPPLNSITGKGLLLDTFEDNFFVYNHSRNSICMGNVLDLYSSHPNEDFPIEEEFKLSLKMPCLVQQLSLHPISADSCILWGEKVVATICFGSRVSEKIQLSREIIVAETMYKKNPNLKVIQCKWVPSISHKVIVVLNSDSFLRVYNVDTVEPLGVYNLGPPDCTPLTLKLSLEIDPQTPVDFDFGPCFQESKLWTIFVLKVNGSIHCALLSLVGTNLRCLLDSYQQIKRLVEKNESSLEDGDFTSILCTKQSPTVIVTGNDTGSIIHSILLPINSEDDCEDDESVEGNLMKNNFVLYTKERLKFNKPGSLPTFGPQLIPDPIFEARYVCVHDGGVHLVMMTFLHEIIKFFDTEEQNLSSLSPSTCQQLLLWRIVDQIEASNKALGTSFSLSQPQKLICALNDKRTIIHNVPHPNDFGCSSESDDNFTRSYKSDASNQLNMKNPLKEVQHLLRNTVAQPFLCSDQKISNTQLVKLAQTAMKIKLDQVEGLQDSASYLISYLNSIETKSAELGSLVSDVLKFRKDLKDAVEYMAEKQEERSEQDLLLTKRMNDLLFRYHQTFPILTDKENTWQQLFKELKLECDSIKDSVERFKVKVEQLHIKDKDVDTKFATSQLRQVRDEISYQHAYITKMITNLRQINDKLASG